VSRRFVALSAERMSEWLAAYLSQLDLLAIQIDGTHFTSELTLLAAIGIDGEGAKHTLDLLEGATENAVVFSCSRLNSHRIRTMRGGSGRFRLLLSPMSSLSAFLGYFYCPAARSVIRYG
jgi:hypothetical protein